MLLRPTNATGKALHNIGHHVRHVNRLPSYLPSRGVHSEPEKALIHHTKVKVKGIPRYTDPRQITIEAKRPGAASKQQLLAAARRFRMSQRPWNIYTRKSQQAFVILATPSFSKWLEDDKDFIPELLKRVTRTTSSEESLENPSSQKEAAPFEIDVLCACVDGLSPGIDWIPKNKGRSAKEGFSILQGRTNEILPGLWKREDSTVANSLGMQSSLSFTNTRGETHVTLPLANTLFANGRHSTLLVSRWRDEDGTFVKARWREKRNQIIKIFDSRKLGMPPTFIPAIPLTPARRITSGLGNIVRQVDFGEGGAGPASRELEANINEYLEVTGHLKSAIAVWALIVPKISQPTSLSEPPYELLVDIDQIKNYWQASTPSNEFIGYWIARGAKLCRVLSGGGGWGAKQGLLSLDPQITYSDVSESQFDFSSGSIENQQSSALGDIAQPDAYIQFFIAEGKGQITGSIKHSKTESVHQWRKSIVIGAVPSTVDDLPTSALVDTSGVRNVVVEAGHFGAVSESGIFVSAPPISSKTKSDIRTTGIHTKIDLPFSYFYRDLRLEKALPEKSTPPKEELQSPIRAVAYDTPLIRKTTHR